MDQIFLPTYAMPRPNKSIPSKALAGIPLQNLGLSARTQNVLLRSGYTSVLHVKKLIDQGRVDQISGIGGLAHSELQARLTEFLSKPLELNSNIQPTLFSSQNVEGASTTVPIHVLEIIPVEVAIHLLPPGQSKYISENNFQSLGELVSFAQAVLEAMKHDVSKALCHTLKKNQEELHTIIELGRLDPNAKYKNFSVLELATLTPSDLNSQILIIQCLREIQQFTSVTDELRELLRHVDERKLDVFLDHFGDQETLEEIGEELGITRERVRQIAKKTATELWDHANVTSTIYIQSSIAASENLGSRLSLNSWEEYLRQIRVLDTVGVDSANISPEKNDSFYILVALLRSITKVDSSVLPVTIPKSLQAALNQPPEISLGVSALFASNTSGLRRSIKRKISYIGGIHESELCELLAVQPDDVNTIATMLQLIETAAGWYSFAKCQKVSRFPIKNAGLKMLEACGPLEYEIFLDGLRRYASRFYQALAPSKTVKHILLQLGFEIEENFVSWSESPQGHLAVTDMAFIASIKHYGHAVSFQEVALTFFERELSLPAVTMSLRHSPIVEKIGTSLYKLRGQNLPKDEIEAARRRQNSVERNPRIHYGTDGIIRYRVTLDSWAISGVLSIGTQESALPDLGDGWVLICNKKNIGQAKRDENLMWGLSPAFKELGVRPGDRIELAFDAWNDPCIVISLTQNE